MQEPIMTEKPVIDPVPSGLTVEQTCLLTTHYEVLRLVLWHMPSRQLHAARAVCRAWRDVADIVLRRRRAGAGAALWDTEPAAAGEPPPAAAGRLLDRLLARCYAEPALAFFVQSLKDAPGLRKHVPQLAARLPPGCALAGVTSVTGCVATPAGGAPLEEQSRDRLGLLLLPRRRGATVGACTVRVRAPATAEQLRGQLPAGAWDGLRAALVFFSSRRGMHAAAALARLVHAQFGGAAALAGGWADLVTPRAPPDALLLVYFSGPAVRAASVVVDDQVGGRLALDTDEAARRLAALRLAPADTLGFMVACCGRNEYAFAPGHEAAVFARHVPGVPLFGAFVNGEVGFTTPAGPREKQRPVADSEPMVLSYTTLLMLVNFADAEECDKTRPKADEASARSRAGTVP